MTLPRRTAKMYSKGSFIRSESGRVLQSGDVWGCNASRKDVRDAVSAALQAQPAWASSKALLRGMVLYRLGESLSRRSDIPGFREAAARAVWWAGWAEKLQLISSSVNPVPGHLVVSSIEPVGVVGLPVAHTTGPVLDPASSPALLVEEAIDALASALAAGCAAVVVLPTSLADIAQSLAEVIHVSDIPPGCANILTSDDREALCTLLSHGDVALCDVSHISHWGVSLEEALELGSVHMQRTPTARVEMSPSRALSMCDTKTVWHPVHA